MEGGGTSVVAALLVLALVAAVPAAGGTGTAPSSSLAGASQVEPDNVVLRASVDADGSAAWEVEYLVALDDENTTEAFESLRADIRTNRSRFESRFADRMRRTARTAENTTGRDMAIRDVTVSTGRQTLGREFGVVTYTFEWDGFAAVNGSRLEAGDALAGLFLDADTSLRIAWPDGYRRVAVAPDPDESDEDAVAWTGRRDFGADEPRLVVTSEPAPGTTADPGAGRDGGRGDGGSGIPPVALVIGVLALGAVGAAGWRYVRRRDEPSAAGGRTTGDDSGNTGGTEPDPPEELLSNEERVLRLLEEHGGRMKQQQVAEELEWTDAKTSQVVSSLREDDGIESFRLGRENVLTLPDHDLTEDAGDGEGNDGPGENGNGG